MKNYILLSCLFYLFLLLTGCATSTGQVSIYSVNDKSRLVNPLESAAILNVGDDVIHKTNNTISNSGDDTFSIYMTDSYFRYLPDFGGVNEVILVIEFTEAVKGDDSDTVTKILGPYDSVSDASKAPFFHKLIYGPKKMESDILSMSIKIFEYDLEENKKAGSMLDFVATSGEALSLANPVTIAEIQTVKEIAKALISTNDNDLVFQMDMDFVAGNSLYHQAANKNLGILPLKAGELVMIKQEACGIGRCYDYFSNDENIFSNPVGYITDGIMLLPNAFVRGWSDSPSSSALKYVDLDKLKINGSQLESQSNILDDDYSDYKEKTWLRLSILKGGDDALWAARKALYPSEKELNSLLKSSSSIDVSDIISLGEELQKTKENIKRLKQNKIAISSEHNNNGSHFLLASDSSTNLCYSMPSHITFVDNSQVFVWDPTDPTKRNNPIKSNSPKNHQCYSLIRSIPLAVSGKEFFQVNYEDNKKLHSIITPIKIVDPITITSTSSCKTDQEGSFKLSISVNHYSSLLGVQINGKFVDYSTENNDIVLEMSKNTGSVSIVSVFKSTPIAVPNPVNNCP